jgi:hypothetical protein
MPAVEGDLVGERDVHADPRAPAGQQRAAFRIVR